MQLRVVRRPVDEGRPTLRVVRFQRREIEHQRFRIEDAIRAVLDRAVLERLGRAETIEHLAVEHAASRRADRSEEHTSELQSLMRISYAVFCLKKKKTKQTYTSPKTTSREQKTQTNNI